MLSSRLFSSLTASARIAQAIASSSGSGSPSIHTRLIASSSRPTAAHTSCSSCCQRALSTSAVLSGTVGSLGGGKLKTHKGTKKRFQPVGSVDGMFKHAHAGKSHLNSHMPSVRRARLRGMAVTPPGQTARHLKRLLGPIL
ncbi:hypothetical protein OC861_006426 [Tilletia horrida]|nr:hypothetical protein OC861_006426 [Tilletia horrida]